jgi:hypothetical protein
MNSLNYNGNIIENRVNSQNMRKGHDALFVFKEKKKKKLSQHTFEKNIKSRMFFFSFFQKIKELPSSFS